jgi:predicted hotdog family 3-hydroxylacyl-ACP dehydratase
MCLLDAVLNWNEQEIVCTTTSHRRSTNPLRDGAGLRGSCAIEYGAQAMAAHSALVDATGRSRPEAGLLVSIRDVSVSVARLDEIDAPLVVRARLVLKQGRAQVYEITVTAGGEIILTGRISTMTP